MKFEPIKELSIVNGVALRPLSISVRRRTWRMTDAHTTDRDKAFKSVKDKILLRDDYTCQYCAFHSKPNEYGASLLEVDHLDDDHTNNVDRNLVTACTFCHMVHHIGYAGMTNKAVLIYLPEIPQYYLSHLARALLITSVDEDKTYDASAKSLQAALESRSLYLEEVVGLGSSDPFIFGQAVIDAGMDNINKNTMSGIRLLPLAAQHAILGQSLLNQGFKGYGVDQWAGIASGFSIGEAIKSQMSFNYNNDDNGASSDSDFINDLSTQPTDLPMGLTVDATESERSESEQNNVSDNNEFFTSADFIGLSSLSGLDNQTTDQISNPEGHEFGEATQADLPEELGLNAVHDYGSDIVEADVLVDSLEVTEAQTSNEPQPTTEDGVTAESSMEQFSNEPTDAIEHADVQQAQDQGLMAESSMFDVMTDSLDTPAIYDEVLSPNPVEGTQESSAQTEEHKEEALYDLATDSHAIFSNVSTESQDNVEASPEAEESVQAYVPENEITVDETPAIESNHTEAPSEATNRQEDEEGTLDESSIFEFSLHALEGKPEQTETETAANNPEHNNDISDNTTIAVSAEELVNDAKISQTVTPQNTQVHDSIEKDAKLEDSSNDGFDALAFINDIADIRKNEHYFDVNAPVPDEDAPAEMIEEHKPEETDSLYPDEESIVGIDLSVFNTAKGEDEEEDGRP